MLYRKSRGGKGCAGSCAGGLCGGIVRALVVVVRGLCGETLASSHFRSAGIICSILQGLVQKAENNLPISAPVADNHGYQWTSESGNHLKCQDFLTFFMISLVEWGMWGAQNH